MRRVMKLAALSAAATMALAACGDAPAEDEATQGQTPTDTGTSEPAEPTDTEETSAPADGGIQTGEETTTDETDQTGAAPPGDAADFKACMVSDAGGFDDQSFNEAAYSGMIAAEEALGIETAEAQSSSDADYGPNIEAMVQQNCDLTIGVGFLLEDAIQSAAEANPDAQFALVDSAFSDADFNPVELENAKPILFNTAEAAFLAGYVAAGVSETGTVATYGGLPIPSVTIFMDGFVDGVAKYNEDSGTDVQVLGWDKEAQEGAFAGGFDDQSQGSALGEQFITQGADVILPVAGPVGLGTAAVAEGSDVKLIWVDSDGYESTEYGELMLTSVLKNLGPAVEGAITETVDGSFSNEPYVGSLENDGVGIAPFHDFEDEVPQELKDQVEEYRQQIIDGTLVVESASTPGR